MIRLGLKGLYFDLLAWINRQLWGVSAGWARYRLAMGDEIASVNSDSGRTYALACA
jgi:hypothetical protein